MVVHHIGLLVTGAEAVKDFALFTATLRTWHPDAVLYVFTDSATEPALRAANNPHTHIRVALDAYAGRDRAKMESTPGIIYDTMFKDYTFEKANVLEWMSELTGGSVPLWLMDADILHLAPLPDVPDTAVLALSPHSIRAADEARFGHYNAGFLWIRDLSLLRIWRGEGHRSTFYEQKALELVASSVPAGALYEFPDTVNFGWWRMFQSAEDPATILERFRLYRPDNSIGIRYNGAPLQSIHTHFYRFDKSPTHMFNVWFANFLDKFKVHKPIRRLLDRLIPIFQEEASKEQQQQTQK